MNEQQALDEISYIKKIIDDSRKTLAENGVGYIVWGILVLLGLLSTYFFIVNKIYDAIPWNWAILIGGGWIYTIVDVTKKRKQKKPMTFAKKISSALWLSSGIAMTILGFIAPASGAISSGFIGPLISILLGVTYFVSGVLYNYKWISILAIGWWVGAIVMFYLPGMQMLLVMSFMVLTLQIVPGILLYIKFKKEFADNL